MNRKQRFLYGMGFGLVASVGSLFVGWLIMNGILWLSIYIVDPVILSVSAFILICSILGGCIALSKEYD